MKLETQLFDLCKKLNFNCSITYQVINDYSIEIYKGYKQNHVLFYFTDGHINKEYAIKRALKFLNKLL